MKKPEVMKNFDNTYYEMKVKKKTIFWKGKKSKSRTLQGLDKERALHFG